MARLDVVLNVRSLEKSLAFYRALGFRVTNEYKHEGTLSFVELTYRGGVSLSLANLEMNEDPAFVAWTSGTLGGGVLVSITTSGLDKIHAAAQAVGAEIEQPPQETEFGRQMILADPDGYSLMYWERAPMKRAAKRSRARSTAKKGARPKRSRTAR
jgi:predicted lactoylglutathione lyase